jgi:hypothetical protein
MIYVLVMNDHWLSAVDYLLVWWILRRHVIQQLHVLSVHLVYAIVITLVHCVRDAVGVPVDLLDNLGIGRWLRCPGASCCILSQVVGDVLDTGVHGLVVGGLRLGYSILATDLFVLAS